MTTHIYLLTFLAFWTLMQVYASVCILVTLSITVCLYDYMYIFAHVSCILGTYASVCLLDTHEYRLYTFSYIPVSLYHHIYLRTFLTFWTLLYLCKCMHFRHLYMHVSVTMDTHEFPPYITAFCIFHACVCICKYLSLWAHMSFLLTMQLFEFFTHAVTHRHF